MPEQERCTICGERIPEGQLAEMWDTTVPQESATDADSGYVHVECGLSRGWEVA